MRYVMLDPHAPGRPVGALMPQPAIIPSASTNGLLSPHVHGYPGTRGIRSPRPAAIPETAAGWRLNQPSRVSPDTMYPSQYWATAENCHGPAGLFRDNQLPVPAVRIYNMPRVSMRRRRVGGQNQIGQPAVSQTWPQWKGSR